MRFTVVTFNCRGCSQLPSNQRVFQDLLPFLPDLLLLQETNLKTSSALFWRTWPYTFIHEFSPLSVGAGVSVAVHSRLQSLVTDFSLVASSCGLFLYVTLTVAATTLHIFNVHLSHRPGMSREVLTLLTGHLRSLPPASVVILGGDFNCTLDPLLDRTVSVEPYVSLASALRHLVATYGLVDCFRSLHPASSSFTWWPSSPHFSPARLDRFYISPSLAPTLFSIVHSPTTSSDHHLVSASFSLFSRIPRFSSWTFPRHLLTDDTFTSFCRSLLLDTLHSAHFSSDPVSLWVSLKARLRSEALLFSRRQTITAECLRARLRDRVLSSPSSSAARASAVSRLAAIDRARAEDAAFRLRLQFVDSLDRSSRFFFSLERERRSSRVVSAVRTMSGDLVTDPYGICREVHSHFAAFFSASGFSPVFSPHLFAGLPTVSEDAAACLTADFTLEEVVSACRMLSATSAPGPDGLSIAFYQTHIDLLGPLLLQLFRSMAASQSLPPAFTTSHISLHPKTGDLALLANWRPICLLNTDYKIFAKILSLRLNSVLPSLLHWSQTYSVPGRSISTNLHILRDLIHLASSRSERLALLSLDQSKAFDRVDHGYLFHLLSVYGFPGPFVALLRLLYTSSVFHVRTGCLATSAIDFGRGIRQGCPLSGQLFSLVLEPFLQLLRVRLSASPSRALSWHHRLVVLAYADDVTVLARSDADFPVLSH